ncbi:MAG: hypothetical protein Q7T05_07240 [Dehalococcoidia bacterium]|nr:hypothetical protein [Dehalococcoidia bacterium]
MLTLQDFIYHTKAWEYIIAICFLAVFIVFWKVLSRDRPAEQTQPAIEDDRTKAQLSGSFKRWATVGVTLAIAAALVVLATSRSSTNVQIPDSMLTMAPASPTSSALPTPTTTVITTPATQTPTSSATIPASSTTQPVPATTLPTTATPPASTATGPSALPATHQGRTICKACHASGLGPKFPATPDHAAFADNPAICQACHKAP